MLLTPSCILFVPYGLQVHPNMTCKRQQERKISKKWLKNRNNTPLWMVGHATHPFLYPLCSLWPQSASKHVKNMCKHQWERKISEKWQKNRNKISL
jgi:hypothetical protein